MPDFEINFVSKQANSAGLQLADLIARPIGLRLLRPQKLNRAFDIIQPKIWRGPQVQSPWYGLKVLPRKRKVPVDRDHDADRERTPIHFDLYKATSPHRKAPRQLAVEGIRTGDPAIPSGRS